MVFIFVIILALIYLFHYLLQLREIIFYFLYVSAILQAKEFIKVGITDVFFN